MAALGNIEHAEQTAVRALADYTPLVNGAEGGDSHRFLNVAGDPYPI